MSNVHSSRRRSPNLAYGCLILLALLCRACAFSSSGIPVPDCTRTAGTEGGIWYADTDEVTCAGKYSDVECGQGATVVAQDGSLVTAHSGCTVYAYKGATVLKCAEQPPATVLDESSDHSVEVYPYCK